MGEFKLQCGDVCCEDPTMQGFPLCCPDDGDCGVGEEGFFCECTDGCE